MTDITKLTQEMKAVAEKAKHAGEAPVMPFDTRISTLNEYQLTVCPDNVLALVEALELKEEQRANWFQMAQKLGEDLDAAEKRIAELESRTVTVKLPEPFKLAKSSSGLTYYFADDVDAALTAAGIKWEAE